MEFIVGDILVWSLAGQLQLLPNNIWKTITMWIFKGLIFMWQQIPDFVWML